LESAFPSQSWTNWVNRNGKSPKLLHKNFG
jgi:hypothetical protein